MRGLAHPYPHSATASASLLQKTKWNKLLPWLWWHGTLASPSCTVLLPVQGKREEQAKIFGRSQ